MASSIFDEKSKQPTKSDLYAVLGEAAVWLKDIEQYLADRFGEVTHEFKFYSKKAGWTMALVHKKRRVFHLVPRAGSFEVVFTLGERAVAAAQKSGLSDEVVAGIKSARKYAEGRLVRLDVVTAKDVAVVKQLIAIKMTN